MGAEPYDYLVAYDPDPQAALERLRADVFASGRYRGAEENPESPEEALEMMDEDGTASILDIMRISDQPDFCAAAPLSDAELEACFGTKRPTVEQIKASGAFWDAIQRGHARYVVVYEGDEPRSLFFAGYSFD